MNRFDNKLEKLDIDIVSLGSQIEKALISTVSALMNQDKILSQTVIDNDKEINASSYNIEREALKILLKEHPVASDLRSISTVLKVVGDMERIGDQARDICGIVIHLSSLGKYKKDITDIHQMGELSKFMVNKSVEALIKSDMNICEEVIKLDERMDKLFHKVKNDMIELIKIDSEYADQAIYLLMVSKYFEKIGDHAESIVNWIKFHITGEHKSTKLL